MPPYWRRLTINAGVGNGPRNRAGSLATDPRRAGLPPFLFVCFDRGPDQQHVLLGSSDEITQPLSAGSTLTMDVFLPHKDAGTQLQQTPV